MNPRESSLLQAAATLLSGNRDTAYGPAHAVRDALLLEWEVMEQADGARRFSSAEPISNSASDRADDFRKAGAL